MPALAGLLRSDACDAHAIWVGEEFRAARADLAAYEAECGSKLAEYRRQYDETRQAWKDQGSNSMHFTFTNSMTCNGDKFND